MRGHEPVIIDDFNGLWKRGPSDECPLDHFHDCDNLQFPPNAFETRDGLNTYSLGSPSFNNVLRIYNYVLQTGESLLILDSTGSIYHAVSPTTTYGPILTIPGMTDFGFVAIAGRAYITPFFTDVTSLGASYQRGMQNEYVYVYKGDGTAARRIGGAPPTGTLALANGAAGSVEAGIHIFGVAYETDTGFITQIAGFAQITAPGAQQVDITNIPTSPDTFVIARRIVATAAIDPTTFTGDLTGYQFFFVPNGRIADNTTTILTVDFFDSDLITDASHLLDLFTNVAAGVGLTTYHGRLCVCTQYTDISLIRVSYPGEPEAFDQVNGLVIIPLDGNPITICQEFRDILYAFKKTRTVAVVDNNGVPSSWPVAVLDQGIGAPVHGIGTVLDSGGVNIDFLVVADYSGLMLFNGAYTRPELSWKIKDYWFALTRDDFDEIQIMNDSLGQILYITLPGGLMLVGYYDEAGLNYKTIKFTPWSFDILATTIALIETNKLIIGSAGLRP